MEWEGRSDPRGLEIFRVFSRKCISEGKLLFLEGECFDRKIIVYFLANCLDCLSSVIRADFDGSG